MEKDLRFKLARIRRGMTQRDLAIGANLSEHIISKYETRRLTPKIEIQEHIAGLLGVTRFEIF